MIPIVKTGSNLRGMPFLAVVDGLSNSLLIGEKQVSRDDLNNPNTAFKFDGVVWSGGQQGASVRRAGPSNPFAQDPGTPYAQQFGSNHPGVIEFVFGDGSVHALKTSLAPSVQAMLANIKDGQAI